MPTKTLSVLLDDSKSEHRNIRRGKHFFFEWKKFFLFLLFDFPLSVFFSRGFSRGSRPMDMSETPNGDRIPEQKGDREVTQTKACSPEPPKRSAASACGTLCASQSFGRSASSLGSF